MISIISYHIFPRTQASILSQISPTLELLLLHPNKFNNLTTVKKHQADSELLTRKLLITQVNLTPHPQSPRKGF
jgi:hypothetical protein